MALAELGGLDGFEVQRARAAAAGVAGVDTYALLDDAVLLAPWIGYGAAFGDHTTIVRGRGGVTALNLNPP